MSVIAVGRSPVTLVCPACKATVITTMEYKATKRTHLWGLCLFLFCCWPCSCLPYCGKMCDKIEHVCPYCKAHIGTYMT